MVSREKLVQQLSTGGLLSPPDAIGSSSTKKVDAAAAVAFQKHKESVLRLLEAQDQWDSACPFFAFKLTQDDSTGWWITSAKEAAVS